MINEMMPIPTQYSPFDDESSLLVDEYEPFLSRLRASDKKINQLVSELELAKSKEKINDVLYSQTLETLYRRVEEREDSLRRIREDLNRLSRCNRDLVRKNKEISDRNENLSKEIIDLNVRYENLSIENELNKSLMKLQQEENKSLTEKLEQLKPKCEPLPHDKQLLENAP